MQRHDVASTLRRRYIYVMCPLGNEYSEHVLQNAISLSGFNEAVVRKRYEFIDIPNDGQLCILGNANIIQKHRCLIYVRLTTGNKYQNMDPKRNEKSEHII